ncbi:peptide ABC transporter ATPase [Levilactobacillus koreensis JCM 16448]|uniref:Sulfate ABC transporter ATP-binding protein n=1 Tax=Levilactobacillus koreensis TaxID=637971 RepID=A0AAC8UTQ4_9LACO|nr:ABC transporter ATP-binding protein/permease [Levilactobacillus koreensis]AKP63948.1 sulfate ABC transporter ATP-binding protein [Levilactobacillus koreensis]KRK86340.1 peptide ABC transporter ATPase [Levilactobacillus koreensis JCM 16448]
MLELKHIKKYYYVGDSVTKALDDVSVAFRSQEFVAILGPSGSGKTTMLNGIGGLDIYDSGDLAIEGKSTKDFSEADWDAYRNNSVGFIFQSYNIIGHLSILDNVEMGMTLSGVSNQEKKEKALKALDRVGLTDHIGKKPNQLSGGQLQRVAIARAIANEPEILLCDEPTGALDTETSDEIMQLIKELSAERLVIMVTHNPDLARQYADRIIEFADGKIQHDSDPYDEHADAEQFELKKTKMTFWTALKLSFNNIRTKKGRTTLTAFASSIGIIGIAIVLALSNGFQAQINKTQANTLAQFPVTISQTATSTTGGANSNDKVKTSKSNQVKAKVSDADKATHTNKLTKGYLNYVKKLDSKLSKNVTYTYSTGMNLLREVDGKAKTVSFSNTDSSNANSASAMSAAMANSTGVGVSVYPSANDGGTTFLKKHYKLLSGAYPKGANDVVLIVDRDNSTNINALKNLGYSVKDNQKFNYGKIVGTTIKAVNNNDYYQSLTTGNYVPNKATTSLYNKTDNTTIKIAGILRVKSKSSENVLASGIAYSDKLTQNIIQANKNSKIVKAQKKADSNVITGQNVDNTTKKTLVSYLGGSTTPASILIYPNTFKNKDKVLSYLDKYNKGKSKADKVIYTDMAGTVSSLTGGLMDAITYVLVAFAGISLVTSMIMIAIITYTSVLERTKEIGILKALGARKKDITRVFDAETFILGVGSGALGVVIAWLLTFPINIVLQNITDLSNVAHLNPVHGIVLIIISTVLTMLGGHIPARMAAKKDAATALRSE